MGQETLRVVVIEDHEITRNGIVTILGRADIDTVGTAETAGEALDVIEGTEPDVVLLDVRLPDEIGIRTLRRIRERFPEIPVLILTSHGHPTLARAAVSGGAAGFILKRIDSKRLADAIWQVARGESVYDEEVAVALQAGDLGIDPRLLELSPRQRQVLVCLGEGLTNRQIAERFSLSEKTVKNYVSAILERIGVASRSGAAAYIARIQAENEILWPPEEW